MRRLDKQVKGDDGVSNEGQRAWRAERHLRDAIADQLRAQGFKATCEGWTPGGPVDIFAWQASGLHSVNYQLVEVKMAADRRTAAHALGQLLFYQTEYARRDRCTLWFASPEQPDERIMRILSKHGVNWCDAQAEGFDLWSEERIQADTQSRETDWRKWFTYA